MRLRTQGQTVARPGMQGWFNTLMFINVIHLHIYLSASFLIRQHEGFCVWLWVACFKKSETASAFEIKLFKIKLFVTSC